MSNVSQIYGTLRDSEPYIILNSTQTEVSGNLSVLQNLDVCGNITFNNTDLSTALSNLVVDLTGGQDASFTKVDISNELNVLSSNGSTGTIRTQNYYVGSRNIVSANAEAKFTDLELKDSNTNVLNFLASGSSGDVSMNGTLNVSTINHANDVNIEGVTIQNKNITMNGNLTLNNIDVSGKLTQIDASLVALASGGGGGGGTTLNVLYDLEPNTTNSAAIINYIGENFKPYESWWLSEFTYTHDSLRDSNAHPVPPQGIRPFATSIVIPNGKLIFVPQDLSNVGIFDPDTEIYSSGAPITPGDVEQVAFSGGALAPNGNVIFAPYFQPNVGIYNPNTDTYTSVDTSYARQARLFWGAVLAPNGKIIFAPATHTHIGIFDPITEIYTDGPPHLLPIQGSNATFSGAILAPNGKIFFIPSWGSSKIGIYDPISNIFTLGSGTGSVGGWQGGVLAPNGKIILVPQYSANIGIYDPDTDHFSTGDTHNEAMPSFDGGVLAPDGKIIFAPFYSANIGIYDPITDIYTSGLQHNKSNYTYTGGTLAPNGKIILTPSRISNIGIYGNDYPLKYKNDVLAPYFNN